MNRHALLAFRCFAAGVIFIGLMMIGGVDTALGREVKGAFAVDVMNRSALQESLSADLEVSVTAEGLPVNVVVLVSVYRELPVLETSFLLAEVRVSQSKVTLSRQDGDRVSGVASVSTVLPGASPVAGWYRIQVAPSPAQHPSLRSQLQQQEYELTATTQVLVGTAADHVSGLWKEYEGVLGVVDAMLETYEKTDPQAKLPPAQPLPGAESRSPDQPAPRSIEEIKAEYEKRKQRQADIDAQPAQEAPGPREGYQWSCVEGVRQMRGFGQSLLDRRSSSSLVACVDLCESMRHEMQTALAEGGGDFGNYAAQIRLATLRLFLHEVMARSMAAMRSHRERLDDALANANALHVEREWRLLQAWAEELAPVLTRVADQSLSPESVKRYDADSAKGDVSVEYALVRQANTNFVDAVREPEVGKKGKATRALEACVENLWGMIETYRAGINDGVKPETKAQWKGFEEGGNALLQVLAPHVMPRHGND